MMNRPIVNIDLDGCVYDFGGDIRRWIALSEGIPYDEINVPSWGIKDGKFDRWWRLGVEAGYVWGENASAPLEGAREAMWKLSDMEYHIRIVTLRLVQSWNHALIIRNTVDWLDQHNIPYRSISFIGPNEKKSDFHAIAGIDDRPDHVREYMAEHIYGYLLPQWWNENDREGLVVASWEEFVDDLELYKLTNA